MVDVHYRVDDAGGVRWVLDVTSTGAPDAVAAELVRREPGARVVAEDDVLVAALVQAGGTVQRRAYDCERDLRDIPPEWRAPPLPTGYALAPIGAPHHLVAAHERAYPPGHPDHEPGLDHLRDLTGLLAGQVVGPYVAAASWQVARDGDPCGAVIVVDRSAFGTMSARLWLVDLFVDRAHGGRGLGRALLHRSLAGAADAGYPIVGLVVSAGNAALDLYRSAGFRVVSSGCNVDLPG